MNLRIFRVFLCFVLGCLAPLAAAQSTVLPAGLADDEEARGFADLSFAQGMVALADARYSDALALFEQATDIRPDDATYRYYVGICQSRLELYDLAIESLERSLPPAHSRVSESAIHRALGEAYHLKGDLASAQREMAEAGADLGDLSLGEPASDSTPPRFDFRLGLAFEVDDNPGQVADDFPLPGNESDTRTRLDFRGAFQPLVGSNDLALGLVLKGYAARHDDFKAADLDIIQGVVQLAGGSDALGFFNGPLGYAPVPVGQGRVGWLVQVGQSYSSLEDESFRRNLEAAASLILAQPGFGKTQIELHYNDIDFQDTFYDPIGYSGHDVMLRVGQYFQLGSRADRTLRVALFGQAHSRDEPGLEHDSLGVLTELALPISPRVALFLYGSFAQAEYDDASMDFFFAPKPREDDRLDAALTLVITVSDDGQVILRYGMTDRDVTPAVELSALSYERGIGSVSYSWHW